MLTADQPALSVQQLWCALSEGGIGLRLDGDALEIIATPGQLTPPLLDAIKTHKERLIEEAKRLTILRDDCRLLSDRIIQMRVSDPPKGTRRAGLDWIQKRLNALRVRSGGGPGYDDPSDPFADTAFVALQEELNEVQAYGNPYPLGPLTDDPFSMDPPRLYNGKLA